MDRRPGMLPRAAADRVAAVDMNQSAGLQRLVVRYVKSLVTQLVREEPIPELGIISMSVQHSVRRMRIGPFPLAHSQA